MSRATLGYLTERDHQVFTQLFENRVMSIKQLQAEVFRGVGASVTSERLSKLCKNHFIEKHFVSGANDRAQRIYMNTSKGVAAIANTYRYSITSDLCRSDSIEHDLKLVEIRKRLCRLSGVTNYFTENMLQACERFLELEETRAFVVANTDAVLEITRSSKKILVGIEFENSEKAQSRYLDKIANYYAGNDGVIFFYICASDRIHKAIVAAESKIIGTKRPRCFYSLLENVLGPSNHCTFVDCKGAKIVMENVSPAPTKHLRIES